MSSMNSDSNSTPRDGKSRKPTAPPEEKFWQRYSPHHEFPLSSVSSVCLYALLGLLTWAVVAFAMKKSEDLAPLPVDSITIAGGGGKPLGFGTVGRGDKPIVDPKEAVGNTTKPTPPPPTVADANLKDVKPKPIDLPDVKVDLSRILEQSNQAVAKAQRDVNPDALRQLYEGLSGPVSEGKGGSGEGGGKGSGKGTGEGRDQGPGTEKNGSLRQKRVGRWIMHFSTRSGRDYLAQLRALGAFIAIPQGDGRYLVLRDLRKIPARGQVESLDKLKRIFWVDSDAQSVAALASALQLSEIPANVVALFPAELESELLKKELKYRGRKEEQITETHFKVIPSGRGYEPIVEDQR